MMEQIIKIVQDTLNDQQKTIEELGRKHLRVLCEFESLMDNIEETGVKGAYSIQKYYLESAKKVIAEEKP